METVRKEGNRNVTRQIEYYNLDLVLSIGYRVNSKKATHFRQWANKILKKYILEGYTINRHRIKSNYDGFLKAVDDVKNLLPAGFSIDKDSVLELITLFADTWPAAIKFDWVLKLHRILKFIALKFLNAFKQRNNYMYRSKNVY
jgi:hypothetical protein